LVDARRRSRRRPAGADGPFADQAAPVEPEPFYPELVDALMKLTAEQRDVVALRFVADLPIDAVATLTGRTSGAVKALQHRALDALPLELGQGWSPISATGA
jgi:RNA polymerase sigma-70 factor, ECF subfamily